MYVKLRIPECAGGDGVSALGRIALRYRVAANEKRVGELRAVSSPFYDARIILGLRRRIARQAIAVSTRTHEPGSGIGMNISITA
jgi:hypothetical protein